MSIPSRLRALRSPDAACARALFVGQDLPPGAPAGQQALARLLEVAAGPGTAQELAGEVAAAAAFVQVTSQVRPRKTTRWALVAAACAVAVGGTAMYASVLPSPHHKMVPVPFGVPASHHAIPAPAATRPPLRPPGGWHAHPSSPTADRKAHQATNPKVPQPGGGR
jgi:hypothetical protein